jgi:glycosyltransferase involved in cell wall biosynthesis
VSTARLSIVMPAFNEEANIDEAIRRATAVGERLCAEHEIVIVDDGSTDATRSLVRKAAEVDPRIRFVCHDRNRGYGHAVRTGLRTAQMDFVFMTDADLQFDLEQLEAFLPWIERVDVVAGFREKRQDPFSRRVAARAWNYLVRVLFYVPVRDIDCAFKLFRRSVLLEMELESVGNMINTELMVKLGRSGASVVEIGVDHYPRRAGKAKGVTLGVITTALFELRSMYRRLYRHDLRSAGQRPATPDLAVSGGEPEPGQKPRTEGRRA